MDQAVEALQPVPVRRSNFLLQVLLLLTWFLLLKVESAFVSFKQVSSILVKVSSNLKVTQDNVANF